MRVLALITALSEGEPMTWVEALAAIVTRAHVVDDIDALQTLETITQATADPALPYLPAIARLFLSASPQGQLPHQLKRQLGPERPLRPTDRPLTLGERKSLARTHRRDKLTLMVRDPHPDVVTILLDNPHVTESDIVKMAAARPAVPDSLTKIASHPRWSVRHAVKRALVLNPSTPLADAIRIATTLRSAELAELAADASLPEPLRKHATDVLADLHSRPRA